MSEQHSRPLPSMLHPNDAALQAISEMREAALLHRDAVDELLEHAQRQDQPAEMRIVRIPSTGGENPVNDRHRNAYKSLGVWVPAATAAGGLNPTGAGVFVGVAGMSARIGSGAPFVAAGSAIVLPISDIDVELGADPAVLGASSVTVHVFFYDAVQALYVR